MSIFNVKNIIIGFLVFAGLFFAISVTQASSDATPPTIMDNAPNGFVNIDVTLPTISGSIVSTSIWTYCASENGTCSFSGTKKVRYGADTRYSIKTFTDGVSCSNGLSGFGNDPASGTVKACYILVSSGTGTVVSSGTLGPHVWYNDPITVAFTCADNQSEIASCTPDQTVSSEGFNQSVTGTAVDNAGNQNTAVVSGINIDLTAPATTETETINSTTKYVTVNLNANDNGSGVAATYFTVDGGDQQTGNMIQLYMEGNHNITYWSVDFVGNIEIHKSKNVKVELLQMDSNGQFHINDVVKLINQGTLQEQDMNYDGIFDSTDINIMLNAITPISMFLSV